MTKGITGLAFLVGLLIGASGQSEQDLATLSREELLRLKQQLQDERKQLHRFGEEDDSLWREVYAYKEKPLVLPDAPKVGLPWGAVLVKIESVRRVDEEVLRAYPDSPTDAFYYELQARVVKVWVEKPRPIKAGDRLSLLWIGCRLERGQEKAVPLTWQVGKEYLVYNLRPVPKAGYDSDKPKGDWLVVASTNCGMRVIGSKAYISQIVNPNYEFPSYSSALELRELPFGIESPSASLLQLMEEEASVFQLSDRVAQMEWVKRRVEDRRLPLWKRQRALIYWFVAAYYSIAFSPEPFDEARRRQLMRSQEFLAWLQSLSEPALQAYGLSLVRKLDHKWLDEPSVEGVERACRIVEAFLDPGYSQTVRREAARLLERYMPYVSGYMDKAVWEWWKAYARELRSRWERENDAVVRYYLGGVWIGIAARDVEYRLESVERQLKAIGQ